MKLADTTTVSAASRPRVVIVGGGFGGLACARSLDGEPVDVVLIDRDNYHLFTPLLYQVATALLNPSDIAYPLRKIFRRSANVRFRQGLVTGVDFESHSVRLSDGDTIGYDRLVLATGSANAYFGAPALAGNTIGMKQLGEALRLRNHVLSCLELASRERDPEARRALLTFVVAGGGPTGVEYAGALGELLRLVIGRDYPDLTLQEARIVLVEGRDRLLDQSNARLGEYANRILQRRGIAVRLGTRVNSADTCSARLADGETISCRTVVWSAGVRAADPVSEPSVRRTPTGRLRVDAFLRLEGVDGVYAIGDAAAVRSERGDLPMLSAPALQEGRYVARRILSEARDGHESVRTPFRYLDKGTMATIGRKSAVAEIGPIRTGGFLGWLIWLVVHVYYLIGFRNRLAVLWSWSWYYVRKDRAIRIIARSDGDGLAEMVDSPLTSSSPTDDRAARESSVQAL